MNGKSGERRNIPRSLRLFEITADFPANLARAASCDIIATRVQPKPSSIHPRRTRVWLKTPRLPTNITVKERAEQFRAIAVPLIRVVFRLKKLKKKNKKTTLEYFLKKAAAKSRVSAATITQKLEKKNVKTD